MRIEIEPTAILKGQEVRAERYREDIAVGSSLAMEYIAAGDEDAVYGDEGKYFLLKGAPIVMPTEPGAYRGSTGSLWVLTRDGRWLDFSAWGGVESFTAVNNPYYHPLVKIEGLN